MKLRALNVPLPSVDGIGPSTVWLPAGAWKTILDFLQQRFTEVSASTWIARMARGDVVDEHGVRIAPDARYRGGIRLYYYRELEAETPIPFEATILYRDEHILVVDKPHFLPVIPSGRFLRETLLVRLKKKLLLDFLVPIHRIDRETAGIVLFSIQPQSRGDYQSLFQRREVVKTYEALAAARPALTFPMTYRSRLVEGDPFFRMQQVAGVPNAETLIDIMEVDAEVARYRLTPVTGRKHQLRVHLAALGAPIINDAFYPCVLPCKGDDFSRPLQLLARRIEFVDPLTRAPRSFESARQLAGK